MSEEQFPDRVPGVFANRAAAEAAIVDLRNAGFSEGDIGIAVPEPGRYATHEDREGIEVRSIARGIAAGAPLGAIAGMLISALAVPGTAATIGVGGAMIAGGAGGAVWGTFLGAFTGFTAKVKLDDYEDRYCEIPLNGSDVLVVVRAGKRAPNVRDLMVKHGARCFLDGSTARSEGSSTAG